MIKTTLQPSRARARLIRDLGAWLVMLPGLILFVFFIWEPLLEAIRLSLYEAKGMTLVRFVGLQNYIDVLKGPDFWPAVANTFKYLLWSLLIGFLLPMALAIGIHESVRGKGLYRTAVYLPNIVPGLATVFLWRYLFKSDAYGGLNMLLGMMGIPPQDWLNNAARVIPMIVITMTWKGQAPQPCSIWQACRASAPNCMRPPSSTALTCGSAWRMSRCRNYTIWHARCSFCRLSACSRCFTSHWS